MEFLAAESRAVEENTSGETQEKEEGVRTGREMSERHPAISFGSVSKRYQKDLPLLDQVSFDLNYGELLLLVGPSGSGKTTILQMAAALLPPDSGEIVIDSTKIFAAGRGEKRRKWKEGEELRRSLISYVPQEDLLLESLTVFENVALALDLRGGKEENDDGDSTGRDQRVRAALSDLGIDHLADRMVYQISAGERRRCAIARGLVRNPKILIADEPTSSLDIEKTSEFMKMLKSRQQEQARNEDERKMAVLIASHDVLEVEPFANKVYEIRNGTLFLKGERKE